MAIFNGRYFGLFLLGKGIVNKKEEIYIKNIDIVWIPPFSFNDCCQFGYMYDIISDREELGKETV